MQLPKYKKKKRIKLKVCQEPGCGREFWGHPIAKYCELHRDIKKCCLEGCNELFTIRVFPKQYIYPRFCEEHRNDFKRANYLRIISKLKND